MESGSILHLALLRKTLRKKKCTKIPTFLKGRDKIVLDQQSISGWSADPFDNTQNELILKSKNLIPIKEAFAKKRKISIQSQRVRTYSHRNDRVFSSEKTPISNVNQNSQNYRQIISYIDLSLQSLNNVNKQNHRPSFLVRKKYSLTNSKQKDAISFTKFISELNISEKKIRRMKRNLK